MTYKRIPEFMLEADPELLRDMTGTVPTNRKQLETAGKALREVLERDLTPRQRELIYLYYYQQMNQKQIAEQLHLHHTTVSRTLRRARENIYQSMHIYFDYIYLRLEEDG